MFSTIVCSTRFPTYEFKGLFKSDEISLASLTLIFCGFFHQKKMQKREILMADFKFGKIHCTTTSFYITLVCLGSCKSKSPKQFMFKRTFREDGTHKITTTINA